MPVFFVAKITAINSNFSIVWNAFSELLSPKAAPVIVSLILYLRGSTGSEYSPSINL